MSNDNYSVYCLTENQRRVRYFGITKCGVEHRFQNHLNAAQSNISGLKNNWLRECLASNIRVDAKMLRDNLCEERALAIEKRLIKLYGKAFQLVNVAQFRRAGQPKPPTPKVKNKKETYLVARHRLFIRNGGEADFTINIRTRSGKRTQIAVTRYGSTFITSDGVKSARSIARGLEMLLRFCVP